MRNKSFKIEVLDNSTIKIQNYKRLNDKVFISENDNSIQAFLFLKYTDTGKLSVITEADSDVDLMISIYAKYNNSGIIYSHGEVGLVTEINKGNITVALKDDSYHIDKSVEVSYGECGTATLGKLLEIQKASIETYLCNLVESM